MRHVTPLLPVQFREFDAELPSGGVVVLRFDEWIGRSYLQHGLVVRPGRAGVPPRSARARSRRDRRRRQRGRVHRVRGAPRRCDRTGDRGGGRRRVRASPPLQPRTQRNRERERHRGRGGRVRWRGRVDARRRPRVLVDQAARLVSRSRRVTNRSNEEARHDLDRRGRAGGRVREDRRRGCRAGGDRRLGAAARERCRPALVVEVSAETEPEVRSRLQSFGYADVTPAGFSKANRAFRAD